MVTEILPIAVCELINFTMVSCLQVCISKNSLAQSIMDTSFLEL